MKAILQFNLSDENPEDEWDYKVISQAKEMYLSLCEIEILLHKFEKHPSGKTIDNLIEEIKAIIYERHINLEI